MSEISQIFENLAFPVAVCVILFCILFFFVKKALSMLTEILKGNEQKQSEYVDYLKTSNAKLISVIEKNTEAIQKFSYVLENITNDKK
jgi:hypothetical protein